MESLRFMVTGFRFVLNVVISFWKTELDRFADTVDSRGSITVCDD
jgi:hypothetical protein